MAADAGRRDDALGDRIDERDAVAEIARDGERAVGRARDRDREERQRHRHVAVDEAGRRVDVCELFRAGDGQPHAVAVEITQRNAIGAVERDAAHVFERRGVEDAQRRFAVAGLELDHARAVAREGDSLRQRSHRRDGAVGAADRPARRQQRQAGCGDDGRHQRRARERAGDGSMQQRACHAIGRDARALNAIAIARGPNATTSATVIRKNAGCTNGRSSCGIARQPTFVPAIAMQNNP